MPGKPQPDPRCDCYFRQPLWNADEHAHYPEYALVAGSPARAGIDRSCSGTWDWGARFPRGGRDRPHSVVSGHRGQPAASSPRQR